ncbi:LOW QUALITY PROTEIN: putative G-protein coupled receptor 33 [Ctenodactylus gundi]
MDQINFSDNMTNASTLVRNSAHAPSPASKIIIALLLFIAFVTGAITSGLYLWVKFQMQRTVNALLFFHLVLSYFLSIWILTFMATSYLDNHWALGTALCKILSGALSVGMFASVFFLSAISLDKYLFTLHPVWSQHSPRWATTFVLGIWLATMTLRHLVFRETHYDHRGVTCEITAVSTSWKESKEIQALRKRIHVACFTRCFLLGLILPFLLIIFCHKRVSSKMRERGLVKSSKTVKVTMAAVVSFFVCWVPYHVYQGFLLTKSQSLLLELTLIITVVTISFNTIFSPTLYLFVGEKFQKVFKKSILLFDSTFRDDSSAERT